MAQLLIIFKSLLSSTAERLLSLIFENDVPSARILQIDFIPLCTTKAIIELKKLVLLRQHKLRNRTHINEHMKSTMSLYSEIQQRQVR